MRPLNIPPEPRAIRHGAAAGTQAVREHDTCRAESRRDHADQRTDAPRLLPCVQPA
jgi:hypothetical protein